VCKIKEKNIERKLKIATQTRKMAGVMKVLLKSSYQSIDTVWGLHERILVDYLL